MILKTLGLGTKASKNEPANFTLTSLVTKSLWYTLFGTNTLATSNFSGDVGELHVSSGNTCLSLRDVRISCCLVDNYHLLRSSNLRKKDT